MEVCPAFIDETGVLTASTNDQPVYGIGLLIVPETKFITDSFYKLHFSFVSDANTRRSELRDRLLKEETYLSVPEVDRMMWSTRHHEYKFTEVTAFNIQQYVDLVNLYFSFREMEFHALIMDRRDPKFDMSSWGSNSWDAYVAITKELLRRRLKRDVFAIMDLQGKPDRSPVYPEDELGKLNKVKGCLRATSETSIFLQIVDVLLGCVQYDWRDSRGYNSFTSRRGQAKRDLCRLVKSHLGLRPDEPIVPDSTNFRRRERPSTFTAWRWVSEGS